MIPFKVHPSILKRYIFGKEISPFAVFDNFIATVAYLHLITSYNDFPLFFRREGLPKKPPNISRSPLIPPLSVFSVSTPGEGQAEGGGGGGGGGGAPDCGKLNSPYANGEQHSYESSLNWHIHSSVCVCVLVCVCVCLCVCVRVCTSCTYTHNLRHKNACVHDTMCM